MAKIRLTSTFVRNAICPPGQAKVTFVDLDHIGLMLEVRVSGRKTFYQRYIDPRGNERQFKIGTADVISLEQARRKGKQIKADAVLGPDPREKRKELKSSITFRTFISDRYMPHVQEYKRSWKTDETLLRRHILPVLGELYLDEVTAEHVSDMLKGMRKKGLAIGTTNRALVAVRFAFNLAIRWKLGGVQQNPTAPIPLGEAVYRDRFLSHSEARTLLRALEEDENQQAANAILLLMLTGARRNEITHAKWEFVDWRKCTMLVPISKSGKPRKITLNVQAIALLKSIKRTKGNPYIFPSAETGRPSPSVYSPWNRIRKRAGLRDVRLHDLRHSFASFLVNGGVSIYAVQKLLGHAHIQTTQRYAHLSNDTLQEAAEVAVSFIHNER